MQTIALIAVREGVVQLGAVKQVFLDFNTWKIILYAYINIYSFMFSVCMLSTR